MLPSREAIEQLKGQVATFQVDGEPIELEWKNFPRFTGLEILCRIQNDLENSHIEPDTNNDRILFMPMFNDIDIYKTGYEDARTSTSHKVRQYASRFVQGHWALFIGRGCEAQWFRGYYCKPKGEWDSVTSQMVKHS